MTGSLPPERCPAENGCIINNPLDPECGTSAYHLAPLDLAEDLCPRALRFYYDELKAGDIAHDNRRIHNSVAIGWVALETGLAEGDSSRYREAKLQFASAVTNKPTMAAHLRAKHALNYLDAFKDRQERGTVSEATIIKRYRSLGWEMQNAQHMSQRRLSEYHQRLIVGANAELVIAGLLMRTKDPQWFPYPASEREDRSIVTNDPLFDQHHDYYLLNNKEKQAIQVKWGHRSVATKEYDPAITVLHARQLALWIGNSFETGQNDDYENLLVLARLMVSESTDQVLDPYDTDMLDAATDWIQEPLRVKRLPDRKN